MAHFLWGKVYFHDNFVGFLREEPGQSISFTYDLNYLNSGHPSISNTLPLKSEPYISHSGLHPFFDNLVAEGWLESAQTRLLGKHTASRFELLLAFGLDCAGAVSVIDPEPEKLDQALIDPNNPMELTVMASSASLSGVQPKLALIKDDKVLRPARRGETSTHIGKFPTRHLDDMVANEFLTTIAIKALLPEDDVVELYIGDIQGFDEQALIIKRFDRHDEPDGKHSKRIHFEEFNQLLGLTSNAKYDGAHKDMANFINTTKGCLPSETYRLYLRIIAGLLLGNTDMHFKNFAMFNTGSSFRLTPSYDQFSGFIYNYKTIALAIYGARNLPLGNIKPVNIIKLGEEFGLKPEAIKMANDQLAKNLEACKQVISESKLGSEILKNQLIDLIGKRWNGTFALIGNHLSKKP